MSFKIEVKPNEYPISPEVYSAMVEKNEEKEKKPRKKRTKKIGDAEVVTAEEELPMVQSNVPYKDSYIETDNILRSAISELGVAAREIGEDLNTIRQSKTLRKKYDYIAALQGSRATIMNTTVAAVREMNNSIKTSHDLELKRAKEMKIGAEQKDDVKYIQDMYNAFVSMPVSQNLADPNAFSPLGPTSGTLTLPGSNVAGYLPTSVDPDAGYQNYLNNMTPEQMTMMIEENPHINEVIAYDPNTGNATFEVYNSENGQFIQGIPKKNAEMFMPDMEFDFNTMQAHSQNLNATFDIMYVNGPGAAPQNTPSNIMDNY